MFEFIWPWALVLLPMPFLIQWLLPAKNQHANFALKVPFYQHLKQLANYNIEPQKINLILLWLMWSLLVLAVSGPRWVGKPQPVQREGRNIMLALDLSGSMQQADMEINNKPVTRLTVVKNAAQNFINQRQNDRLGLVLFGTNAYLQTPLTFDKKTILHMLNDATVGLAGQTTSIGDAIALSVKRLIKTPENSRLLILLTDGANNSGNIEPIQAAKIAKKYNIKIYTIGLGAEQLVMRTVFGPQVYNPSQDLDETVLKKIAKLTGGEYFRAKDSKQLKNIYNKINQLEVVKVDSQVFRPITVYYYIPLALAFLCFLLIVFIPFGHNIIRNNLRGRHV